MTGANGTQTGVIRFWRDAKGFGFIDGDNGDEHFFHITEVIGTDEPAPGMRVQFEIGPGKDGRSKAVSVRVI